LIIALLVLHTVVWAQSTKEWEVRGSVEGKTLSQDMDDGIDFDAELIISAFFVHPEVGTKDIALPADHNWDVSGQSLVGLFVPTPKIEGRECPQHDKITVTYSLVESDTTNLVENIVIGVAVGVVAAGGVVAVYGTGGQAIWVLTTTDVGASVVGGLLGAAIGSAQGVEKLGKNTTVLPPVSRQLPIKDKKTGKGAVLSGVDYSYEDSGTMLECAKAFHPAALEAPADVAAQIFDPLESALAAVPSVAREPGTFHLCEHNMDTLRETWEVTIVQVGELAAANAVGACDGYAGCDPALVSLVSARALRDTGSWTAALAAYRQAFLEGHTAWFNAIPSSGITFPKGVALTTSMIQAAPGDYLEVGVWVQGMDPGENLDAVSVDGQPGGFEADSFPGNQRLGVALAGDLDTEFLEDQLIGTARIGGGRIDPPDGGCGTDHLVDGSGFNQGIFIDQTFGPFLEPDPGGCGYGPVFAVTAPISGGGIPTGAAAENPSFHTLTISLGDALEPGEYDLTVTAQISGPGGPREEVAPLLLVVPKVYPDPTIFADDFETGSTGAW